MKTTGSPRRKQTWRLTSHETRDERIRDERNSTNDAPHRSQERRPKKSRQRRERIPERIHKSTLCFRVHERRVRVHPVTLATPALLRAVNLSTRRRKQIHE